MGVGNDALRRLDAGRHQERRPVHGMEAHNVLADNVRAGPSVAPMLRVRIADRRQVVHQRIEPHVDGLLRIARARNAPLHSLAAARHR